MDVIVNADDFGMTKGINEGIIDAHINGVVTRTTLIMNGLAVSEAIELAKKTPTLKVGIHLALSFGKPLAQHEDSLLIDKNGHFKYTSIETALSKPEVHQIKVEWQFQIEQFLKTGLTLDHIDSHHHVHGWSDLKDVVLELSNEYNVPVRSTDSLKDYPEKLLTEYLWLDFYKEGVKTTLFEELSLLPVKSVEVMVHPAVTDTDLKRVSSYTDERKKEKDILKSIRPKEFMSLC